MGPIVIIFLSRDQKHEVLHYYLIDNYSYIFYYVFRYEFYYNRLQSLFNVFT